MQSTVPMGSNMLTLTVGMPDLGWVKEAAPLLWRMLREAIVSSFRRDRDGEGENGILVSYFGDVSDDESVAIWGITPRQGRQLSSVKGGGAVCECKRKSFSCTVGPV